MAAYYADFANRPERARQLTRAQAFEALAAKYPEDDEAQIFAALYIAGKTGTTSDYKDAWFVGYTGGFVTAVWTGKDDNTPMKRVTGGGAPAEIWRTFMAAALPRLKATPIPGGVVEPPPIENTDPIGDLMNTTPGPEGPAAETPAGAAPPADQLPY